ncbi:hypothetical protein IAE35_02320 [Pseudomonas sp. S75]|nr:hypothetical protein [Pseudomonas sp. S30]MBK0152161.1 hypothetical protein [Pseudomonas sp. S75]
MTRDDNGPAAAYPGPAGAQDDTGRGSDLEHTASEPRQAAGGKPEDWTPPPGNPGSDQDSQVPRDNGTARTSQDEPVARQGISDVDANNAVSSEHPKP